MLVKKKLMEMTLFAVVRNMKHQKNYGILISLIVTLFANPVLAESSYDSDKLTGSWGGKRTEIAENGVDLEFVYKGDVGRNFMGGVSVGNSYLENFDARLSIDAEKIWGLKGTSFFIYGLGNNISHTQLPSEMVGDIQVTDNIEAGATDFKLYEAWGETNLLEGRLSVLFGLRDLNADFYSTASSGALLNSSFGIGNEFAQTGVNGPSIFPYTAPALRIKATPGQNFYLQTGIFGAQAGDPEKPTGTHINMTASEGFLLVTELGVAASDGEANFKYALGGWTYTRPVASLVDGSGQVNNGIYVLIDQGIGKDFSIFSRYGVAHTAVNDVGSCFSAGFLWSAPFFGQEGDLLSLAMARVTLGQEFREIQEQSGISTNEGETAIELTYKRQVYAGVFLQPDLQYIVDPGAQEEQQDALMGTLRLEMSF